MNDYRLSEIRARAEAATPGPWGVSGEHGYCQIGPREEGGWCKPCLESDARSNDLAQEDAEFTARAREDVPYLLELVERLTAELATARSDLADAITRRNRAPLEARKAVAGEIERLRALIDAMVTGPGEEETTVTALRPEPTPEQGVYLHLTFTGSAGRLCGADVGNDCLCALPPGHAGRCGVYVMPNEAMRERQRQFVEQMRAEAEKGTTP